MTVASSARVSPMRSIVVIAVFTALAAAGGLVKLPSPVGSIALDSAPGYFVAGFFSPSLGGVAGFLGHLASAAIAGFPLAIAHLPVAVMQFIWCFVFGFIVRKGDSFLFLVLGSIVATVLNGVVAPLLLAALFPQFRGMISTLIPFLLLASALNVVLSAFAIKVLSRLDVPGL